MIGLLLSLSEEVVDGDEEVLEEKFNAFDAKREALLKRLGRLP